ncbi:MAG: glycosyltransferase family 9 protein [bacterium]
MKHFLKKVLIKIIVRYFSDTITGQNPVTVRKILIVRQDNRMGNLLFITPLIKALGAYLQGAEIFVITGWMFKDLLENNPFVSSVICYDQKKFLMNPMLFVKFLKRLRRNPFDAVIDCKRDFSLNNALIIAASRSGCKIGFESNAAPGIYSRTVARPPLRNHESQILMLLAGPLIQEIKKTPMEYYISHYESEWAQKKMAEIGFGGFERRKVLGVHPGARGLKQWPIELLIKVIDRMAENKELSILVFLGPNEEEIAMRYYINVKTVRPGSVRELGALVSKCSVMLANDSGPLHLSIALGVPTLGLFVSSPLSLYAWQERPHRYIQGKDITVFSVAANLNEMLEVSG